MSRRQVGIALGVAGGLTGLLVGIVGPSLITESKSHISGPVLGPIAAVVWIAMVVAERKTGRRLTEFTAVFAGLALAAVVLQYSVAIPRALQGEQVRAWSQFHYYVGSKYFAELGYFDLYKATVAADDDYLAAGGDPAAGYANAGRVRDMHTYSLGPRHEAVASFDRSVISPERLAELGEDTRFFRTHETDDRARRVVMDLGYNPAPPWTLLGVPVANAIDPGSALWPLVTISDLVVHIVVFCALLWAFGPRVACIAAVWVHTIPLNTGLMIGGFFNYDWLAATVLAVCAWHKERPRLAAVALSWAAMTRVFPGLMALPLLGRLGWDIVHRRTPDPAKVQFAVVFCSLSALLLAASHTTGRGADTWPEWKEKITIHSAHHPSSGARRVGLGKLVRHQPKAGKFWRTPRRTSPDRGRSIHRRKLAVTTLGLVLLAAALRRRTDVEAMILVLFASWMLTTSSRYYASVWLLFFVLPTRGPPGRSAAPGVVAGFGLMAMLALFNTPTGTVTGRYLLLNYEALAMFAGICVAYIVSDLRARQGAAEPAQL